MVVTVRVFVARQRKVCAHADVYANLPSHIKIMPVLVDVDFCPERTRDRLWLHTACVCKTNDCSTRAASDFYLRRRLRVDSPREASS